MHVKWVRQSSNKELKGRALNLEAVLVESHPGNGSTRQRVVARLGVIGEKFLGTKIRNMREFHQGLFWVTVDKNLDYLKLDPALRNKIESEILKKVPRPHDDWALWGVTCIPKFDS